MKGLAAEALVVAVAALTVMGVYSLNLAYQTDLIQRENIERGTIEAITQTEFVKKAFEESLAYSTYQGIADTLTYGKYQIQGCDPQRAADGTPFWRANDSVCIPSNLEQSLSENIQDIFQQYMTNLRLQTEKIGITIPDYRTKTSLGSVNIEVESDKKIEFNNENIELRAKPSTKFSFKINVNDLITNGINDFVNDDPIKSRVESVVEGTINACKEVIFTKCVNPDVAFTFPSKPQIREQDALCSSVLARATGQIENNVNSLSNTLDNDRMDVTVQIQSRLIQITVDDFNEEGDACAETITESDSSCGENSCLRKECIDGISQGNTNFCIVDYEEPCPTQENPQKVCPKQKVVEKECTLYPTRYTKTCRYNYEQSVDALVKIGDKESPKVPIYDSGRKITTTKDIRLAFFNRYQSPGWIAPVSLPEQRTLPDVGTELQTKSPSLSKYTALDSYFSSNIPSLTGTGSCLLEESAKSGIAIEALIAIPIQEGGWSGTNLQKGLCPSPPNPSDKASNNLFSIKGNYQGSSCQWGTIECASSTSEYPRSNCVLGSTCASPKPYTCSIFSSFKSYPSKCDSIKDFIDFVNPSNNPRYTQAWAVRNDAKTFVTELNKAGYATDPRWSTNLHSIIDKISSEIPKLSYIWPAESKYLTSCYGLRAFPLDPTKQDFHTGVDISGDSFLNQPIYATSLGQVVKTCKVFPLSERVPIIGSIPCGYPGNYVIIHDENGIYSTYSHLNSIDVEERQNVAQGQMIGRGGHTGASTGPHLHFETRDKVFTDAINWGLGFREGSVDACNYIDCSQSTGVSCS